MRSLPKSLGIGLVLVTVFCASFYFFYKRAQKNLPKQPLILTPAVLNQPLPKTNLVNISGEPFRDEELRQGKFILVFMMPDCEPCDQENEFLKTVVASRKDINFIYVLPFGNKDQTLVLGHAKYSLEPFYDDGSNLSRTLQLYQVPIKVLVEDGIIKKVWFDATVGIQKQAEFKNWMRDS